MRFPRQHFDEETGLHYNYFRDYDPSAGRHPASCWGAQCRARSIGIYTETEKSLAAYTQVMKISLDTKMKKQNSYVSRLLFALGLLTAGLGCYWMNAKFESELYHSIIVASLLAWLAINIAHSLLSSSRTERLVLKLSVLAFLVLPLKFFLIMLPHLLDQGS